MPKGASKEIEDIMLTRYACYLIAQNGDDDIDGDMKKEMELLRR